jgi:hypothetical protein
MPNLHINYNFKENICFFTTTLLSEAGNLQNATSETCKWQQRQLSYIRLSIL